MKPAVGDDAVYSALMNNQCGVRVTVRAVMEKTAFVEYATGKIEEVQLTRLSEVPASWNEPVPSIVRPLTLETLVTQLEPSREKRERLMKKRGLK